MDLRLDKSAFDSASREMSNYSRDLEKLRSNIVSSFAQLKIDWDSEAGKAFFEKRLEQELLKNLDDHVVVFEHISNNITTASRKYDEVFRAADSVANAQY